MNEKRKTSGRRRRTREEIQQLVAEFLSSGMRRTEFCRSRGLSFGTLDRHLKKQRWKRKRRAVSSAGRFDRLVPVELAARKSPTQHEPSCGLAVVLSGGRRIEVHPDFDTNTFERLVSALERV
jgi:transposase-like protein